jgi:hypothetical protein
LADACLDRFYDDLEAVVADLLRAAVSIDNLEGWVTSRLVPATVDAHRRRRGAKGALQRPRLPHWLAAGLGHDKWLGDLAIEILVWVGVPITAGTAIWPLECWAERRTAATGDIYGSTVGAVGREVEHVLSVMRTKPRWYEAHVERPLGTKNPPVAPAPIDGDSLHLTLPALALNQPHEAYDAALAEMAAIALEAIASSLAGNPGLDLERVVGTVVARVFGTVELAAEIAEPPHGVFGPHERVPALVANPAEITRITRVVNDILVGSGAAAAGGS